MTEGSITLTIQFVPPGFWQLLEFEYRFKVVSHILQLIETKSWDLDCVPYRESIEYLSELEPQTVMTQCFEYYLSPVNKENETGKWTVC